MEEKKVDKRRETLEKKLEELRSLENEIKKKEKAIKAAEGSKKQVLLRLPQSLWEDVSRWADEDFRSINGQIEYLLTEAVRNRKSKR